jgi:uncharacterized phage protein gp47/JayE
MDNKEGSIIPSAGEVETVQDYIDSVRPVTADVTVFSPVEVSQDFEINLSPNNTVVQEAVQASLRDFIKRESEPGTPLYLSRIQEAISSATGEFDHVLVSPSENIVPEYGEIITLGNITWGAV